jgi:hypothetical protein
MKRVILSIVALVMLFSVPCFGEEKETDWELKYWQAEKIIREKNALILQLQNKLNFFDKIEIEKKIKELEKKRKDDKKEE